MKVRAKQAYDASEKQAIRRLMLEKRNQLTVNDMVQSACSMAEIFMANLKQIIKRGTCIAVYMPINNEIPIYHLFTKLMILKDVSFCLPRVDESYVEEMDFANYSPSKTNLVEAKIGNATVLQPFSYEKPAQPDIVICPLVAFSSKKHRVGYGKGFYDKALETLKLNKQVLTIGCGYSFQKADFAAQVHDVMLDYIVTDGEIIS